jgi:hypothetical protein
MTFHLLIYERKRKADHALVQSFLGFKTGVKRTALRGDLFSDQAANLG